MKAVLGLLLGAVLALSSSIDVRAGEATPPPPDQGPVYVTTYFEVSPQGINQALTRLKEYRDAARGEPGAMQSDILQEVGMPSRFVTNEVWRDWAAYNAHMMATPRGRLFVQMRGAQWGPPDVRTHLAHAIVPPGDAPGANSVTIMSHLDVTPSAIPALNEMMKPLVEASAKDPGMQRFQILRQVPGAGNHLRIYEVWASERAWDAHNAQSHVIEFRNELQQYLGTPYDQRKYQVVN